MGTGLDSAERLDMPSQKKPFFLYSNSLLPFLYQTRTLRPRLLSTYQRTKIVDKHITFRRVILKSYEGSTTDNKPVSEAPSHSYPSESGQRRTIVDTHKAIRRINSNSLERSTTEYKPARGSLPVFEDHSRFYPSESGAPRKNSPNSLGEGTITGFGKAAVLRIYGDINKSAEEASFSLDSSDNDDIDDDLRDLDVDPDRPLEVVFEKATQSLKAKEEKKIEIQRIRFFNSEHRNYIRKQIWGARTDIELWNLLENKIFSLIEVLKQSNKDEAALRIKHGGSVRKSRPIKQITNYTAAKIISPAHLLFLLQKNYSGYCVTALRCFHQHFPTSPYAMQVLPAIKRLGPISYVLGASTKLYNELIYMTWKLYADLDGMTDLLDEMRSQGVEINDETVRILSQVAQIRDQDKLHDEISPLGGDSFHAWWELTAVKDAWDRLNFSLSECRKQVVERETSEKRNLEKMLQKEKDSANRADGAKQVVERKTRRNLKKWLQKDQDSANQADGADPDLIVFDGRAPRAERGAGSESKGLRRTIAATVLPVRECRGRLVPI